MKRNNNDTGYHNINQISDLENVKNPIKQENQKTNCLDDDDKVDDDREKSPDFKKLFKCWLNKKNKDV